ncbi:hypothetical protein ACGFZ9_14405 [Streptomyces mirabilis]
MPGEIGTGTEPGGGTPAAAGERQLAVLAETLPALRKALLARGYPLA